MVRTQIQLTEEQAALLRDLADERGVSMAAVIREAVDRVISERSIETRRLVALGTFGRYRSDATDVSSNHDAYLADAFR